MSWLKKLFGIDKKVIPEPTPQSPFSIEYYPETGRYYPKYKHFYLHKQFCTGIYELEVPRFFMYADYSTTEDGADRIIQLFKEQQLKENVKVLPR